MPTEKRRVGRVARQNVPSGEDVADILVRLGYVLRRTGSGTYADQGWSVPRVLLMLAVDRLGERPRMGQVKDQLGVTGRAITSLVDGLERDQLLARVEDPDDRRATRLEVTLKGRWHLAEIKKVHAAQSESNLSVLTNDERRTLLTLLCKVEQGTRDAQ